MSVLCRLGIHRWMELGLSSLVMPAPLFECLRCHMRKVDYGYATMWVNAPKEGWTDYLEIVQPKVQAGEEGKNA